MGVICSIDGPMHAVFMEISIHATGTPREPSICCLLQVVKTNQHICSTLHDGNNSRQQTLGVYIVNFVK